MSKPWYSIFSRKSKTIPSDTVSEGAPIHNIPRQYWDDVAMAVRSAFTSLGLDMSVYGKQDGYGLNLFASYAEVFFPIDYIASRIAGAHFEIRKVSDDSIVWCTGRSYKAQQIAKILSRPNPMQTWREFVYMHFVNRLATGNGFIRSAMSDTLSPDAEKWKWGSALWTVPSPLVHIRTTSQSVPLFGVADIEDIISGYTIGDSVNAGRLIPAWQIWHDRDITPNMGHSTGQFLYSNSRLDAARHNIEILKKVYDARGTIYSRCGALGILYNEQSDESGPIAMQPKDKKDLERHFNSSYGVIDGKSPVIVTDAKIGYKSIGQSISQLQPFEETLLDAVVIAGLYGIPDVLVPRKDHSTFSNQATAEKTVYNGVIIPMAKTFCQELTEFLGTEKAGYYIDCNFDDIDCLQVGRKEQEEVRKLVNDRCRQQFADGLISYNDWRAQIHESALDGDVFGKTLYEMTDAERQFIRSIYTSSQFRNNDTEDGEDTQPDGDNQD